VTLANSAYNAEIFRFALSDLQPQDVLRGPIHPTRMARPDASSALLGR
jgi:hypothetical protein